MSKINIIFEKTKGGIKKKVFAACMAAAMIMCGMPAVPAKALVMGASNHRFVADGTDGQLPDEEWAKVEQTFNELKGQTMDCSAFVSRVITGADKTFYTATAEKYLTANGYYKVGTRTDFTDGTNYTENADATAAKYRRGDVLVFTSDAGDYKHIAIAATDGDGLISIYHGGVYGNGANGTVDKTTLAWYLSGSKSKDDGYGDNIEVYRKISNGGEGSGDSDEAGDSSEAGDGAEETKVSVHYNTHIQNIGWQGDVNDISTWKKDGEMSGTEGKSYRLEGINVKVTGNDKLGIAYNTHIQKLGWEADIDNPDAWKKDGEMSGTSGKSYRLEAIQLKLTGEAAAGYSVYYRVHVQKLGWLGWACDGEPAGSQGYSYRLEGIEIVVLPKGEMPEGEIGSSFSIASTGDNAGMINYMTHVQGYGDQKYVCDGAMSGTQGESKRLEGIRIKLDTYKTLAGGSVHYLTHVQNEGWQGDENDISTWKKDGEFAGTSGKSYRLEAIRIALSGDMAAKYDIYYRVHVQNLGWLDWACNGEVAGTTGFSYRLEGIEIKLVEKGSAAPGPMDRSYVIKE